MLASPPVSTAPVPTLPLSTRPVAVIETPPTAAPAATVEAATTPVPPVLAAGRRRATALVAVAIILIALNLRLAVTSLGALLGEVGVGLRLDPLTLGVVTTLPTAAFAVFGSITPRLVRRIRPTTLLATGMALLATGQIVRVLTSSVPVFLLATGFALAGVAVGNILLPMLVKQYFPGRLGLITAIYTVSMVLGGTIGAAATVPIADAAGTWRVGLGLWAIPALVALVPVLALWRARRDTRVSAAGPVVRVARSQLGWAIAIFFGMQSFSGFAVMGWLPQIYRDAGFSGRTAGLLLAGVIGAGIPIAFAMPWLAGRRADQRPLVAVLAIASLISYAGLAVAPRAGALVWTALLALGQGAFPLALALVGLRSRTSAGTVALSAFAQSTGYALATVGPLGIGLLYHATGNWHASLAVLSVALVVQAVAGFSAGRPRLLEDSLTLGHQAIGTPAGR